MDGHYRILYAGELMPGRALQEVVPRLAAKFKLQNETARDLILGGRGRVLKHSLTAGEAQRYRDALNDVGLQVTIEPALATSGAAADASTPPQPLRAEAPPRPEANPSASAAARAPNGPTPCPKCGADAVSELTGICQACGVVVERYLAKHGRAQPSAPSRVENPYAPPQADLTPPRAARDRGDEDLLDAPKATPAGHGLLWISEAWQLLKQQPGAWIGAVVLFYIILILVSIVPLIGGLAVTILTPMLSAGLMVGARHQDRAGRFEISHLFAGISTCAGPLALVGLMYLLLAIGIGIIAALLFGAVFATMSTTMDLSALNPEDIDLFLANPVILLPVLVALLLGIPLAMAMYFAPSLVALDRVPVLKAFGLSFVGCLKNILPFLIYGLVAMVLVILGSLPLMLGLLVVLPLLTIAIYTAYRDIFYP